MRRVLDDVAEELLPLALKPLSNSSLSGTSSQSAAKSWVVGRSGFQTGFGVAARGWIAAAAQAGDGAAVGAVDLELDQLVAVDADGPGGVDLRDRRRRRARRSP